MAIPHNVINLSATLTGLEPGTHLASVTAVNAAGESVQSNALSFIITTPPAQVTITGTTVTATTATVSWSIPAGAQVTGFAVGRDGVDSSGTGAWQTLVAATVSTFTFTQLVPGDAYDLTVAPVTTSGTGTPTVSTVTAAPAPSSLTPTWSDEFTGTSLSYATDSGGGTWRTQGYGSSVNNGYTDPAALSWNCSSAQCQQYGVVSVAQSVMTLRPQRNPGIPGVSNSWIGAALTSNYLPPQNLCWRYGYFEWRMSLPNPVRGMFPALWLFNNVPNRSDGYEGAEIDLLEIFGVRTGQPWDGGIHWNPSHYNGTEGQNVVHAFDDTAGWHRYGIEWTPTAINYLKDGTVRGSMTGGGATWFNHANLGIRINYVMDPNFVDSSQQTTANDPPVGTRPTMLLDYVRYYATRPTNLPTGSADPLA